MIRRDPQTELMGRLSGCSLVDAFHICVLNDPEVIAASKRIKNVDKYKSLFQKGQLPGPSISYCWPLDFTADGLSFSFVNAGIYVLGDPKPRASEEIREFSEAAIDKWQRFRRWIIDGEFVAQGTFARTGLLQTISPLQWRRANLLVDVQSGDILEPESGKFVALWTGIMLETGRRRRNEVEAIGPESRSRIDISDRMFHGEPTNYNQIRSSSLQRIRRRPVAEQVEQAIARCGVADLPGSRSWKEVATIVAPFMRKQPVSENEWQALIKAVQRHYKGRA